MWIYFRKFCLFIYCHWGSPFSHTREKPHTMSFDQHNFLTACWVPQEIKFLRQRQAKGFPIALFPTKHFFPSPVDVVERTNIAARQPEKKWMTEKNKLKSNRWRDIQQVIISGSSHWVELIKKFSQKNYVDKIWIKL